MKLADAIDDYSEELIIAESYDNGKPEWLARKVDIPRCSENFRFFATAMLHHKTSAFDMDGEALNYTLNPPIGVAGCISPWNLPLYLLTWKIAPAIAVGNTVVAKPSEITPYTAYLVKFVKKINFPKGVVNIIHGYGDTAGDAVVRKCDIISFTGGTKTGRVVAASAAKSFKKCSLELGGKNPSIVFKDCDFENPSKLFCVLRSLIKDRFVCVDPESLLKKIFMISLSVLLLKRQKNLRWVILKLKQDNDLGAIVSEAHLKNIIEHVDNALKGSEDSLWWKKTKINRKTIWWVLHVSNSFIKHQNSDPINQEEVFGPVVTIISFNNERELVELSNQTKYGLSASIFTNDVSKAHGLAAKIDSGLIWINSWLLRDLRIPFGGMKSSGLGRRGK